MRDTILRCRAACSTPRGLWWLLLLGGGAVYGFFGYWPWYLRRLGVSYLGAWFLDLYAIMAANDAVAAGVDPYVPNVFDPLHRPHCYTHWWLVLGRLGLTREDTLWLGIVLCGAFFVAAVAWLRPRQGGEVAWYLIGLASPPILLALERGNNDLAVFVALAPVVPCLLSPRAWVRSLAIGGIVAAAALKAYPLVALPILLAGADARDTRRLLLLGGIVVLIVLPDMVMDFPRYTAVLPHPRGILTMGSQNLFLVFGAPLSASRVLGPVGGLAAIAILWRANLFAAWKIAPPERGAWLSFVLGALVLTGCFFAGASFAYRWVFAVWMLPLLWRLPRDLTAPRLVRHVSTATGVLLITALWADAGVGATLEIVDGAGLSREQLMTMADRFFAWEQPVTWALFLCLLAFLTHFAREGVARVFTGWPSAAPSAPVAHSSP